MELPLDFRASLRARATDAPDTAELRPNSSREQIVAQYLFGPDAGHVSFDGPPDSLRLLFDGEPTRLKLAPRGLAVGPHVVARVDGSAGTLRSDDWTIFSPRSLAALVVDELERLDRIQPKPQPARPALAPVAEPARAPAAALSGAGLRVEDWGIDG